MMFRIRGLGISKRKHLPTDPVGNALLPFHYDVEFFHVTAYLVPSFALLMTMATKIGVVCITEHGAGIRSTGAGPGLAAGGIPSSYLLQFRAEDGTGR